jgi:hypothetical protein
MTLAFGSSVSHTERVCGMKHNDERQIMMKTVVDRKAIKER